MHTIRTLNRGLTVLFELNRLGRAAVNTLAGAARLPRTTTFRILETLRSAGYVERDAEDDCYRATIMVRALSDGFDDGALLAHVARPLLADLATQLVWSLALATPAGAAMLIRTSTECRIEGAPEHCGPGCRLPMLAAAAGRVYLAFCSPAQREALLELLVRSSQPEDRLARNRPEVDRLLNETRTQGYGVAQRAQRTADETSLAVPVRVKGRLLATVTLRYTAGAVPLRAAVEQFVPKLHGLASQIESGFG